MNRKRQYRLRTVLRGGAAFIALAISGAAFAASAAADATDGGHRPATSMLDWPRGQPQEQRKRLALVMARAKGFRDATIDQAPRASTAGAASQANAPRRGRSQLSTLQVEPAAAKNSASEAKM
jgi:hypothetical protein